MRNIFIVDDEPVISNILAVIISAAGFRTYAFDQLRQAIEASKVVSPQLLLLDVNGNGMTGFESARMFREHCPQCKVLLFAGRASSSGLLPVKQSSDPEVQVVSAQLHPADFLVRAPVFHDMMGTNKSVAQVQLQASVASTLASDEFAAQGHAK